MKNKRKQIKKMKKNREYIYLGVIVNTFGIKGELKLFIFFSSLSLSPHLRLIASLFFSHASLYFCKLLSMSYFTTLNAIFTRLSLISGMLPSLQYFIIARVSCPNCSSVRSSNFSRYEVYSFL